MAGSLSGITSTLAVYPFDVLRTNIQVAAFEGKRLTPLQALRNTVRHGGARALYTGLSVPLTAQAVYKGTVFAVNNVTMQCLIEHNTQERRKVGLGGDGPYQPTLFDRFFCGMVGGGVNAALFVTPVEFIRNQLIVAHSQPQSVKATTSAAAAAATGTAGSSSARTVMASGALQGPVSVWKQYGLRGLWKGVGITVARDSIGCGCFFAAMAVCQTLLTPTDTTTSSLGGSNNNNGAVQPAKPSLAVTVLSGAVAGLAYWVGAMPLDSVKTWVQNGSADSAAAAIRENVAKYGIDGTVRRVLGGWQVAFGRGAPSAAITVATYGTCYSYLEQGMQH